MSLHARKPLIFLFVLGAVALSGVMLYFFGGREIVSKHEPFLIFFDDTINGLQSDSSVKFMGVTVGYVDSIRLDYRLSGGDRRIPVLIQLNIDRLQRRLGVLEDLANPAVLADRINRGFRARLKTEHYVTGEMFVELEYRSPVPPYTPSAMPPGMPAYPEIPSVPSQDITNLHKAQDIIAWLPTFDFRTEIEKVGDQIDSATTAVSVVPYAEYNQKATETVRPLTSFNFPAWQRNFDNFLARFDRYQSAIDNANRQFYAQSQDFVTMNHQARDQLQQVNAQLAALRTQLQPDDPSLAHLTHNFEQLSKDMENLTSKLNTFEQQPRLLDKLTK